MNVLEKVLIGVCVLAAFAMWTGECMADDEFKYKLNLLPMSVHHGSTNTTNEKHQGIGLSVTLPNRTTYGLMHFTNSYGDEGWIASISGELDNCTVCLGVGAGYAPVYSKSDHFPVLLWGSVRYEWVTILTVPTEVTAILFSIPIE